MTRDDIFLVVKKHILDISEDLTDEQVDPVKSMRDLGINSLDIVEVVSCAMRELKVKVPRSELSKLTNIDGLVELLYRVSMEKESALAKTTA